MTKMNRMNIYFLAFGGFVVGTAELVVAGILQLIADDLQISIGLTGQLVTAYSLAFAIGTPILVALTSRMGRKTLLVLSLIIFIIGSLVSFISPNYAILMVSRVILGLSAGVYTVSALSSAVKLVPADKMGSAIGMIALGFGSAMALGVPIGIAIAHWWSWQVIFVFLAIVSSLIMLGLIRLLPQVEGDTPVPFTQQFMVLGNPVILTGLVVSLLLYTSNSVMLTYLAPYLESILHLEESRIGIMIFALGVVGAIGSRLGGFSSDKWGSSRTITFAIAVSVGSLTLLPIFNVPLAVGLAFITLWFFSFFMSNPALQTYFIQQAPQSSNLVLGLNLSVVHLGLAMGAGVGGAVVNSVSSVLFNPWVASGIAALGLGATLVSFSLSKRNFPIEFRDSVK
ncbi:DHA1 family putative efflux transporter-like MFS transporter [Paenibacillus sp. V4I9]|uniref:MFS transporter n=1 Tax=Paenibacillus sp. V4I9 TaxID=3042308 RepID=UPI00278581EC|nr:MFS transporter [Paenibacillus sp. V4I9]MDQ0889827.1 DHA1 family putative efflux transporter-like MFS transporter [Paenibacillus sp. V4I9]